MFVPLSQICCCCHEPYSAFMPACHSGHDLLTILLLLQETFRQLVQPTQPCSSSHAAELQPPAAAHQLYQTGLEQVAATSRKSVTADNRQKRDRIMDELAHFFQTELAGMGLTLQNCGYLDILVFMAVSYLPQHGGSMLPDGSVKMAPQSVANVISAISKGLEAIGRGSTWQLGNPAKAPEISTWLRGYTRELTADGFKTTGAMVSPLRGLLLLSYYQACMLPVTLHMLGTFCKTQSCVHGDDHHAKLTCLLDLAACCLLLIACCLLASCPCKTLLLLF